MARKKKKDSTFKTISLSILAVIIGFCAGFAGYGFITLPTDSDKYISGDLKFHFIELGNKYTGDCIYIQCGEIDILVDGGSSTSSVDTIYNYVSQRMTDNKLEYAIITHAHEDHYACFAGTASANSSLFERFEFETIIDFALTNNETSNLYQKYITKLNAEVDTGAKHYTALECYEEQNGAKSSYELANGIYLNILYNYYYSNNSTDENNYSVVFEIVQNDNRFLFTGDLEEDGEEKFVEHYGSNLQKVQLYKAGHHGSKTSSTTALLELIQPEICVVMCVAGSNQYNAKPENTFPTQVFINNIAPYTEKVYVTTQADDSTAGYKSMNGNIVITSNKKGVQVECSNNSTLLKDTQWFSDNRNCPTAWAS